MSRREQSQQVTGQEVINGVPPPEEEPSYRWSLLPQPEHRAHTDVRGPYRLNAADKTHARVKLRQVAEWVLTF